MNVDIPNMAMAGHDDEDDSAVTTNTNSMLFSSILRRAASVRVRPQLVYCVETTVLTRVQAFSTSSARAADLSKLNLIGTLVRDPEIRQTKNEKEYVVYVFSF